MQALAQKLDLTEYFRDFLSFLAREKPPHLGGDIAHNALLLAELENLEFAPPPPLAPLHRDIVHLQKHGILHKEEIFEWVKLLRYMRYLQTLESPPKLKAWWDKIRFPEPLLKLEAEYDSKGGFVSGTFPELDSLYAALAHAKREMTEKLYATLHSEKLRPYLVDSQLHLQDNLETLLVRNGFAAVQKADIIARSSGGFFYILPHSVAHLQQKCSELQNKILLLEHRICAQHSQTMSKHTPFLRYLDSEFDKFDHLQARVCFAKSRTLSFLIPTREKGKDNVIVLVDFAHPAIAHPKPISIDFSKPILLITGVNAGGKTMLLKSLLSAALLSKLLLPMALNVHKSTIGHFRHIEAILDDPQDVKNDISTFAGRMLLFSALFSADKQGSLVGVDEIELGTDSDEAASLFKVLLERLIERKHKIVLTTHHKRLAALMSSNPQLELIAALYDEKNRRPMFSFLQGTIGKSYAFETALRYQIPPDIVDEARKVYGEDKEKLNELIEKSAQLELELQRKNKTLGNEIAKVKQKTQYLQNLITEQHENFAARKRELEMEYDQAIALAKEAAKKQSQSEIHQTMSNANKILQSIKNHDVQRPKAEREFCVGDYVKVRKNRGRIVALKKDKAIVELDFGVRMHFLLHELSLCDVAPIAPKTSVQVSSKASNVSLDLHGLRSDEAIERLDSFLSDALIAGFDEVLVYHGIGTGKLAFAVREFLKSHPKVRDFADATPQLGGLGAKIVRL
ncbi:MAG: endonuclease MutS2 [Helicobacter sp.]|nr:endonuclease MutS2 [Helicobacter sp.]